MKTKPIRFPVEVAPTLEAMTLEQRADMVALALGVTGSTESPMEVLGDGRVSYQVSLPEPLAKAFGEMTDADREITVQLIVLVWKDPSNFDRLILAARDVKECVRRFLKVARLLDQGLPPSPVAARRLLAASGTWGQQLLDLLGDAPVVSGSAGELPNEELERPPGVPSTWDRYPLWLPPRVAYKLPVVQAGIVNDLEKRDSEWDDTLDKYFVAPSKRPEGRAVS